MVQAPIGQGRAAERADGVNGRIALEAIADDLLLGVASVAGQPLLGGVGDFVVQGTSAAGHQHMAVLHDGGSKSRNEHPAQLRIPRYFA
jgi:hypothetical protein